jgi:hypothetical protein
MLPAPGLRAGGFHNQITTQTAKVLEETAMVSSSSFRQLKPKKRTAAGTRWRVAFFNRARSPRPSGTLKKPIPYCLHLEVLEARCLPSLFIPFTPYPVGTNPDSVAVGDFRHDGILDLAVANLRSNTVSVLLGDGEGTFRNATNYSVFAPTSVTVGDLRRNGILDLVVAHESSGVSVLLGNGDGTFQPAVDYSVGSLPVSVAVGDFSRNGILDLAVANEQSDTVSVLLGNGDGTFQAATTYSVGSLPTSIAVGDFRGDGILDLAVTNFHSNTLSVLLGNGDGTFQAATDYPVGSHPSSVAIGDFKGKGVLDLAVANFDDNNVSVLLGNGDGTFQSAVNYTVGLLPASVAVGDFNRDGIPDLAVANEGGTVSVLLGNGDGTFQSAANFPAVPGATMLAVGDFNRDGAPDLALNAFSNNAVDVFLNQEPVTSTVVTSNANPAVAGQLVTFTATVTQAVPGGIAPTGLVVFEDTGVVLGTGTLSASGTAAFSTYSLLAGDHFITAIYEGDANYIGSVSPVLNQVVDQDSTTTSLTVSSNPSLAGQPLELTATVQGTNPGFGPPTGNVLFMDGPTTIGSGTLSGGVATFTSAALAAGSHTLSTVYIGDRNFTGSTAPAVTETINNPVPIITSVSPSTLPEGSAAFTLTLSASNFVPGAIVKWNGISLTVVNASAAQIQASVPAILIGQEGTDLVTVTNPGPGGGTSLAQTFTVTDTLLTANRVNLNVHGSLNFSGTVATFSDGNSNATLADFTAIIVWDDGTANYGTISGTNPFTVSGTHTFAPFHTLHTISVTILDQGGSSATVTDNVIDPTANQAFVMQLYEDLLDRPPDTAGLAYWSGLLDRGTPRVQVALSIEQSLEYRQDEVQGLYARYLYRNADPAGLATFANLLAHDGTLEQVAADIVSSPEYYQTRAGGTNTGFLNALYQDALGRNIDPSGQSLFGSELAAGASRGDVVTAIFGNREYRQDLVEGYYHSILGRSADRSGLAGFTNALAGGARDEVVMTDIFASEEFFTKL